uniref:Hydroxylysine kinase n=1 Tax=Panagrellus redivivus TaxID=6233 RepID=A0A7E4VHF2_PANRE
MSTDPVAWPKPEYNSETVTQTPVISAERLKPILKTVYGVEDCKVFQLTGYDDLNFRIEDVVFDERAHPNIKNDIVFIVKFTNPLESANPYLFDGQVKLADLLRNNGIPTALTLPTVDGKLWEVVSMTDEVTCPIRLFSFLPGVMLEKIGYSGAVYELIGELLAKFHLITADFHHPAYDGGFCHFMCMENWPALEEEFQLQIDRGLLTDPKQIELCRRTFNDMNSDILSKRTEFEAGLTHSDVNETNVLLERGPDGPPVITGLIDFGDTHRSLLIFDIAALVLYTVLDANESDWRPIAESILKGYATKKTPSNIDHLVVSMRGRIVSSLIYALRTVRINYRNEDLSYILKTQTNGWKFLEVLTADYDAAKQ